MPRGPKPRRARPAWSEALRARRLALNLRQEDIAARTNHMISPGAVSDLERGKVALQNLTVGRLNALASALSWTPAEFDAAVGVRLLAP